MSSEQENSGGMRHLLAFTGDSAERSALLKEKGIHDLSWVGRANRGVGVFTHPDQLDVEDWAINLFQYITAATTKACECEGKPVGTNPFNRTCPLCLPSGTITLLPLAVFRVGTAVAKKALPRWEAKNDFGCPTRGGGGCGCPDPGPRFAVKAAEDFLLDPTKEKLARFERCRAEQSDIFGWLGDGMERPIYWLPLLFRDCAELIGLDVVRAAVLEEVRSWKIPC